MTITLVLNDAVRVDLLAASREYLETAGVLLCGVAEPRPGELRLLARAMRWCPPAAYHRREPDALDITPEGYLAALAEANRDGLTPVWVHTHSGEGSSPRHSVHDELVDRQLATLFTLRANCPRYVSLVVAHTGDRLRFAGRVVDTAGETRPIDRAWTPGPRWHLDIADGVEVVVAPIFDRNVRAFGGPAQRTISGLHFGVVGVGGTGSAVVEQLVRLGARHFTLVDPDALSDSNLTRVYGSTPRSVGRQKVEVQADHVRSIAPEAEVRALSAMVTRQAAARELTAVDLIFGCTDDNAGRLVLCRLAAYYNTPLIDVGVLLDSSHEDLRGIYCRVTTVLQGAPCLQCRGRIDLARAQSETLTAGEQARLAGEGYAPELAGIEPAVVAYTSLTASFAVNELLDRLIGFGPQPSATELLLRVHDRAMSRNSESFVPGHFCDPEAGKWARGDTDPFLERLWAS